MRKNLFLSLFVMLCSLSASAQFVGGGTAKSNQSFGEQEFSLRLSYNPITLAVDGDWEDALDELKMDDILNFNGFSFDFRAAFSIVNTIPLYFETGAGLTYAFSRYYDEDKESYYDPYYDVDMDMIASMDFKTKFMSLSIPLNLAYRLSVSDNFAIKPYAGLKGRFNLSLVETLKQEVEVRPDYYDLSDSEEDSYDMFDKDDMEELWGAREKAKRFQLGWQIGLDMEINNFIVGVAYGADMGEIIDDWQFKTTTLSLGIKF